MSYPYHQPDSTRDVLAASKDDRTWAILAHLSTLVCALISLGWASLLGPLLVWALGKDRSDFVRSSAAGAFNFNLAVWAATIVGWICFFTIIGIPVAIVIWIVAFAASLWCHVRGAILANRGQLYRYPWGIKVLS